MRAPALALALGLCACAATNPVDVVPLERFEYRRPAMGVQARIVLYAADEELASSAAEEAFARIGSLEATLSDWSPSSELSQLNAQAGLGPVVVSADLYSVLARSVDLAIASNGAFDPALGALVHLFREQRRLGVRPTPGQIQEARARSGFDLLRLDPERRTVELTVPGMRLDLGGIGKGWACDRALRVLIEKGLGQALVEIGGDLAVGAPPPGREAWRIAAVCGEERRAIDVAFGGVATSGDTEQYVIQDGLRRSHVLDVRTGWGVAGRPGDVPRCVTIVARNAATADAAASALCVLGPDVMLPEAFFGELRRYLE